MKKISMQMNSMDYAVTEAMKTLRTNIQFCGNDKQVLMVTSCVPGEGKTETATRLAFSLAEIKKKVLLIDLDLRKSVMVARVSAQGVDSGMSHFLSGQSVLADVIVSTNIPGLHMAFSGPYAPNPTELLDSDRFRKMLESLREVYDYIIIDAPPLGLVVDAAIIAKYSDGAILVMASGAVKYRMAQDVKNKIEKSGCPILGGVLNKVDHKKNGHYYGQYYGKYYGEYYGSKENQLQGQKV